MLRAVTLILSCKSRGHKKRELAKKTLNDNYEHSCFTPSLQLRVFSNSEEDRKTGTRKALVNRLPATTSDKSNSPAEAKATP